jgi:hypothetical protein
METVNEIVEAFCKKMKRAIKEIEKVNHDEEMSPSLAGFKIGSELSGMSHQIHILDAYFDSNPDSPVMPKIPRVVGYARSTSYRGPLSQGSTRIRYARTPDQDE